MRRFGQVDFDVFFQDSKPFTDFFWALTVQEAEEYLAAFLAQRDRYIGLMWSQVRQAGVVESQERSFEAKDIDPCREWFLQAITVQAKEMRSHSQSPCLSEQLKSQIVGLGFFVGEYVVQRYPDFRWRAGWRGNRYILQNVPVVSNQLGEYDGDDLSPVRGLALECLHAISKPPRRVSMVEEIGQFVAGARRMK